MMTVGDGRHGEHRSTAD